MRKSALPGVYAFAEHRPIEERNSLLRTALEIKLMESLLGRNFCVAIHSARRKEQSQTSLNHFLQHHLHVRAHHD
jgi:hypothetical protein